jgi:hypothetical protein
MSGGEPKSAKKMTSIEEIATTRYNLVTTTSCKYKWETKNNIMTAQTLKCLLGRLKPI